MDHSAHGYQDPHSNPHLPLVQRILLACWTDMDPQDVPGRDDGDGSYEEVAGLITDHDWHANLRIAEVMELTPVEGWSVDDVDQAVTDALHEYPKLRARVAELETSEIRLEWAVRYPAGVVAAAKNSEQVNRALAQRNGGQLVQREIRTGPWTDAQPAGSTR